MSKRLELTGEKFSKLTVLGLDTTRQTKTHWRCVCECGKEIVVYRGHLKDGHTQSCGCLQIERATQANIKHGMRYTCIYSKWLGIQKRCNNSNEPLYKNYGGRGIKCLRQSFEEFRDDMYDSYLKHIKEYGKKNTTIERIDVNGNYCKENCRWATQKEQNRNKRNNNNISYNGIIHTLTERSEILNINRSTLSSRIHKNKWTIEKSFNI